jgi:hypothetical protein
MFIYNTVEGSEMLNHASGILKNAKAIFFLLTVCEKNSESKIKHFKFASFSSYTLCNIARSEISNFRLIMIILVCMAAE